LNDSEVGISTSNLVRNFVYAPSLILNSFVHPWDPFGEDCSNLEPIAKLGHLPLISSHCIDFSIAYHKEDLVL